MAAGEAGGLGQDPLDKSLAAELDAFEEGV